MRKIGKIVIVAMSVGWGSAALAAPTQQVREHDGSTLQRGLEHYLQARVSEANGQFRDAMEAYSRAVSAAPDVAEVRIAYASFLVDIGMPARAIEVLGNGDDTGPEGKRIRALALAQQATRDRGLVAAAEAALREAVAANENDINLRFSLAQMLAQQQKLEEAEELVAGLRQGLSTNSRLVVMHADLLSSLGRSAEAAELYARCAEGGPSSGRCREQYVEAMVETGRPGQAGEALLGWLDDNDLDGLMRAAGLLWEGRRYEKSLETVRRVLARAPDSPRAQVLEAHLLSSTGHFREAEEKLRRLIKRNPDDVDLMLAMAWSTSRLGDHGEGRTWLDRAWEVSSDDAGSTRAMRTALAAARLELVDGHPNIALEWLDRVAEPASVGSEYVRLLAEIFRRQEQWREGVSAMARVQPTLRQQAQREAEAVEAEFLFRLNHDPRAWRRLRPLLDAGDPHIVLLGLEVLQVLERWSDVDRESGAAVERLGWQRDLVFTRAAALERLDEFEESAALFRSLLERTPDDAAAANFLGYMLADRDIALDEAFELIARAVELDPENAAYLDSLGWVHFRRGELAEAERWIRRAIELGGDVGDGTLYCHLGEILLASGEPDESRRFLLLGLDRGCDHQERIRSLLERVGDGRH